MLYRRATGDTRYKIMMIRIDVWEDTKVDGGERVGRVDMPFGSDLIRFIADELNKGHHLNIRGLTDEEARAAKQ